MYHKISTYKKVILFRFSSLALMVAKWLTTNDFSLRKPMLLVFTDCPLLGNKIVFFSKCLRVKSVIAKSLIKSSGFGIIKFLSLILFNELALIKGYFPFSKYLLSCGALVPLSITAISFNFFCLYLPSISLFI